MKTFRHAACWIAVAALASLLGCEVPDLPQLPASEPPPEAVVEAPPEALPVEVGPNGTEVPPMEKPVTKTPRKFISSDPVQGRRVRNMGSAGVPFKAGFYAKYQTMIQSIDHNLQIWSASRGLDVTYPDSHAAFMREIIEPMGVELPRLDEPVEYVFVPEQGEKGLQIRLKSDYPGDIWPPGANPADAVDAPPSPIEQPNQPQPEQPQQFDRSAPPPEEPTPRAVGVEGVGGAAGVAPLDLQ